MPFEEEIKAIAVAYIKGFSSFRPDLYAIMQVLCPSSLLPKSFFFHVRLFPSTMVRTLGAPIIGSSAASRERDGSSNSPSPQRGRGPYKEESRLESIRSALSESRISILRSYYKILQDFVAVIPHSGERIDWSPSIV